MIKIGITGGIGSGKSTVALLMEILGIPVYYADKESKKLTVTSPEIRSKLIVTFGEDIYVNGALNNRLLASFVFDNKQYLDQINAIIHPVVQTHYEDWINSQTSAMCGIESAILFESGFYKLVDICLTVSAPEEIRIQRVINRDHRKKEDIKNILCNQLSDRVRESMADYVIENYDQKALIPQVEAFLMKIKNEQFPEKP